MTEQTQTKLVPKRRFKEFQNNYAWEKRHFFDNIKKTIDFRGRTPKKLGLNWSETGYLALSALNVKNGYIDPNADAHYGNQELYDKWMTGSELKKGQVLFTTEAPMGNVAQVPDDKGYILSQRTIAFDVDPGRITDDFLAVLLRSPKTFAELSALSSGGTAKGVSQKSISQLKVTVPTNLEEQTKIGAFFKNLDHLITLHQCKLEKTKALKSAYLSEMFPAEEDELKPKRRFAGFTQTWEQCKLSDVADYYDGTHQTPKYTEKGVKFISVENIKSIQDSDKYISENDFEKQFKIKPQVNDIFMTRITAGVIGDTALLEEDKPLAYYVSLALIRPKSIVALYLEKYINSPFFKKELHKRIIHTAFPKKINLGDIGECGIKIPNSKKEQVQIGEFFKKMDNTIAIQQFKLEKLQNIKKAFLNEMFV
ncbi:restriction endonuclease subunit S [Paenibacillus peoriae]|uniref:restriction endonuclease subunit S n=1 Tax=Paenibacillus peoriae TaxID=59893 RepID=UPI00215B528F|nr:restriction endonuclease subunit S [Paenibacillus peoriae]